MLGNQTLKILSFSVAENRKRILTKPKGDNDMHTLFSILQKFVAWLNDSICCGTVQREFLCDETIP